MNALLKNAREEKNLTIREVAATLNIDPALISKFESGSRMPTKDQLLKLADLLQINRDKIEILWLKRKILRLVDQNPFALQALKSAETELSGSNPTQPEISPASIQKLMDEMESLKTILSGKK